MCINIIFYFRGCFCPPKVDGYFICDNNVGNICEGIYWHDHVCAFDLFHGVLTTNSTSFETIHHRHCIQLGMQKIIMKNWRKKNLTKMPPSQAGDVVIISPRGRISVRALWSWKNSCFEGLCTLQTHTYKVTRTQTHVGTNFSFAPRRYTVATALEIEGLIDHGCTRL